MNDLDKIQNELELLTWHIFLSLPSFLKFTKAQETYNSRGSLAIKTHEESSPFPCCQKVVLEKIQIIIRMKTHGHPLLLYALTCSEMSHFSCCEIYCVIHLSIAPTVLSLVERYLKECDMVLNIYQLSCCNIIGAYKPVGPSLPPARLSPVPFSLCLESF